ncbi:hypothetical protein TVAG_438870 [Trichomonas vaginalis G3]|uniref:Uncharacterized protein n=1 Tax=Trichomonas vaginalis (strain ATCC PRA-98 / G3) TaxID=412133 RepID=A2FZ87_TRIV3|nr:proton-transporting ATPase activity, rotational mechanism [Trichomonas vaginalis G3]EAX89776.1 hypothetical protein TVAG_438870 [Trichomonas vaginalis G3]KAI5493509.1 proton-transporting ATPase activity, rotational mechanism [Trichomonas vaginalis G3]|eukprot:XP_001302706.1 hypothetical protein [Trichomonas vaginalis G3]
MINTADDSTARSEAFALYQARLRAEEIEFAAREEHDQALKKMVDLSYSKLSSDFELERSKIERNAKINLSISKNQQRIEILNKQREIITKSMDKVREKLQKLVQTPEYKEILKALLKQGVEILNEKVVKVSVTKRDRELIQTIMGELGTETKLSLTDTNLEDKVIGGVYLVSEADTIFIDNTFEERLQLASEGALPEIKNILA